MLPESTILVSLVLSINPLHDGQNHLSLVRFSEETNLSKDKEMDLASGNGIISSFTSSILQKPQVSHVVEVLTDVARMLPSYSGMTLQFIKHYLKDLRDILLGVKLEKNLLTG